MADAQDVNRATVATEALGRIYRDESRRILATLIRLLGDFDLAEEALQDAVAAAAERWPRDGVPNNPRAWLVSAGRHRAIDQNAAGSAVRREEAGAHGAARRGSH